MGSVQCCVYKNVQTISDNYRNTIQVRLTQYKAVVASLVSHNELMSFIIIFAIALERPVELGTSPAVQYPG